MANPMLQQLSMTKLNPLNNAVQQARSIMQNGGQMMNTVRAMVGNGDPQKIFYEECKRRGVDPNSILSMIR